MTSREMAELFGMSKTTINDLYTYYINVNEIDTKMTISEFSNFVLKFIGINIIPKSCNNAPTAISLTLLSGSFIFRATKTESAETLTQ